MFTRKTYYLFNLVNYLIQKNHDINLIITTNCIYLRFNKKFPVATIPPYCRVNSNMVENHRSISILYNIILRWNSMYNSLYLTLMWDARVSSTRRVFFFFLKSIVEPSSDHIRLFELTRHDCSVIRVPSESKSLDEEARVPPQERSFRDASFACSPFSLSLSLSLCFTPISLVSLSVGCSLMFFIKLTRCYEYSFSTVFA